MTHAARPSDPYRDFCLWDYDPVTTPGPGALRQSALLERSLALAPDAPGLARLFGQIRDAWGRFNTVWGVKWTALGPTWEFYFYDYARRDRRLGVADLMRAVPGLFPPGFAAPDDLPYFMFSVELGPAQGRPGAPPLAEVDLYLPGTGGTVSAGVAHAWNGRALRRKNSYEFFQSAADRAAILARLEAFGPLPGWLMPGVWGEEVFVLSEKPASRACYLSRVPVAAARALCMQTDVPAAMTDALTEAGHGAQRFDLGFDMVDGPKGPRIVKVGLYGIL